MVAPIDRSALDRPTEPRGRAISRNVWLVSFTDLVCLLLAFFVLLYSVSDPKPRLGGGDAAPAVVPLRPAGAPARAFDVPQRRPAAATDLDYFAALLRGRFDADPSLAGLRPWRLTDRLVIHLPGRLLFGPIGTTLTQEGRRSLFLLGGILERIGNRVEVVALARPRGALPEDREDWVSALRRAIAVAGALGESGYRRPLAVRARGGAAVPAPRSGPVADGGARAIELVVRAEKG